MTSLIDHYLHTDGPGAQYTVVANPTTSGASPNTVSTTGVASGDFCFWAMSTANSVPNVAGPEGGGWTRLWSPDANSSEIGAAWYKIAGGSEPGTWDWTHSAGTTVTSAALILRGVSTVLDSAFMIESLTYPGLLQGSRKGLVLRVAHATNGALAIPMTESSALSYILVGSQATAINGFRTYSEAAVGQASISDAPGASGVGDFIQGTVLLQ